MLDRLGGQYEGYSLSCVGGGEYDVNVSSRDKEGGLEHFVSCQDGGFQGKPGVQLGALDGSHAVVVGYSVGLYWIVKLAW